MKTIYNKIVCAAMMAVLTGSMASCTSETPFSTESEGLVKMNVTVNTTVTRATPSNLQELQENCVIYVSNESGLLHKWTGVENIPSELYLRYGDYVAEAWSGDSVPVAYEKEGMKFYKGVEPFNVNSATTQVNLHCTLANVVASVEETTIDNSQVKNVKVTFSSTKGSLEFDSSNWADKAYFMMTSDDMTSDGNVLSYVVEGDDIEGNHFTKPGVIKDVKSAHEYRMNFEYHPSEPTDGGAFIQIVIDENIVTDSKDVMFLGKPAFAWDQSDLEVGEQIIGDVGQFVTHTLRIAAYNGFESILVTPVDQSMFNNYLPTVGGFDLIKMTDEYKSGLAAIGVEIATIDDEENKNDLEGVPLHKYVIRFTDKWLNSLSANDKPYELSIVATDVNDKSNETVVSIANTQKAIVMAAPINVDTDGLAKDFTAVKSKSVTLPLTFDDSADLTNAAVQYREVGTEDWKTQSVNISRAAVSASVTLTDLNPSTEYEYRTVAGQIVDGEYELKSKVATFATESVFTIPNASMEEWSNFSEDSKILLPASGGVRTFWDTGNHGSSTMGITLTKSSTDMVHSGSYSARLRSQFVGISSVGKFAAGNLFVGTYVDTDGTDGILEFGRPYDGSHPKALSLWANYRPGTVEKKGAKSNYLSQGDTDKGQIYVAISTAPIEVRTKTSNQKLFNPEDKEILAYGQVTWDGAFGPDNQLQQVTIPLEYYERAKTNEAKYLIIVCSASLYGDYFCGGEGSLLYLDDFELVYE